MGATWNMVWSTNQEPIYNFLLNSTTPINCSTATVREAYTKCAGQFINPNSHIATATVLGLCGRKWRLSYVISCVTILHLSSTLEQQVLMYYTYMKSSCVKKHRWYWHKFQDVTAKDRRTTHATIKLIMTESLHKKIIQIKKKSEYLLKRIGWNCG